MVNWRKEPELLAQARRLYEDEKLSASVVAMTLGNGISRNAVIGIAHRQKWNGAGRDNNPGGIRWHTRQKPLPPGHRPQRAPQTASPPPTPRPEPAIAPAVTAAPLGPVAITDMPTYGRCRWPMWAHGATPDFFCGEPTLMPDAPKGPPYCAEHCRKAYQGGVAAAQRYYFRDHNPNRWRSVR